MSIATGDFDPTAIELQTDPEHRRFRGVAVHGNTPFDVPFVSRITPNLWQGGCESGLVLPRDVKHLVSLYPWERYIVRHAISSELYFTMYDSHDGAPDKKTLERLADWVNECRRDGVTLVHCQAGLNRSSLVAGLALLRSNELSAPEVVQLLRSQRSPAVLCNSSFERWLLDYEPST